MSSEPLTVSVAWPETHPNTLRTSAMLESPQRWPRLGSAFLQSAGGRAQVHSFLLACPLGHDKGLEQRGAPSRLQVHCSALEGGPVSSMHPHFFL